MVRLSLLTAGTATISMTLARVGLRVELMVTFPIKSWVIPEKMHMEPNSIPHPGLHGGGRRAEVHSGRDQPDCLLLLFGTDHQQGKHTQRDGDVLGMRYSGVSLNSAGKTRHQHSLSLSHVLVRAQRPCSMNQGKG